MDKLFTVVGALLLAMLASFFFCVASTLFGALGGYVVGLFYDDTLAKLANWAGLAGTEPWQLGAMLGFVAGFFRSTASTQKRE